MKSGESELSHDAKVVWDTLTDEEKTVIRKEYPIRKSRDEVICRLKSNGVRIALLVELSGLSRSHVNRVGNGVKYGGSVDAINGPENSLDLVKEIKNHKALVDLLHNIANN